MLFRLSRFLVFGHGQLPVSANAQLLHLADLLRLAAAPPLFLLSSRAEKKISKSRSDRRLRIVYPDVFGVQLIAGLDIAADAYKKEVAAGLYIDPNLTFQSWAQKWHED